MSGVQFQCSVLQGGKPSEAAKAPDPVVEKAAEAYAGLRKCRQEGSGAATDTGVRLW